MAEQSIMDVRAETQSWLPSMAAQTMEGPFYPAPSPLRVAIDEGLPGVPLELRFVVVDATTGQPMPNVLVDVWHCDAAGRYSGFTPEEQPAVPVSTVGETFCRGAQPTDERGFAHFTTIYPSWYPGRTAHMHAKVSIDQVNVLTTQLYLPDAISEYIYVHHKAYNDRSTEFKDIYNSNDLVLNAADPSRIGVMAVKEEKDRYVAFLTLGVDPTARPDPDTSGEVPEMPPAPTDRPAAIIPGGLGSR